MRRFRPLLIALVALAVPLVGVAAPASAATARQQETVVPPPVFESFQAEYFLTRDADDHSQLRVVETIVAVYPDEDVNRGFYRDLPDYYQEVALSPRVVAVTDEAGAPVPYEVEEYRAGDGIDLRYTSIAIGDDTYLHGRHEYTIEYTLQDVTMHAPETDTDEFYWDVNGVDTATGIGRVTAIVHLADDLVAALAPGESCYPGYYSQATGCSFERSDDGATFTTVVTDMSAYDTLTIALIFQPGTFAPGVKVTDAWVYRWLPALLAGLSLLVMLGAIALRLLRWRDHPGRGVVVAEYTEPPEHDLLLAADVVGRDHEALAAGFVGLAVRGFVEIVDNGEGSRGPERFALRFLGRDGATHAELQLLKALFGDFEVAETVVVGTLDAATGAGLYALGLRARERAIAAGLRALPPVGPDRVLRAVGWAALAAFLVPLAWASVTEVSWAPVVGWLLVAIVLRVVTGRLLRRPHLLTEKGAELRDHLRGMRDYLELAEEDRLRMLQSTTGADRVDTRDRGAVVRLNERLLPYAMLWGVEDSWAEALELQYTAAGLQASPTGLPVRGLARSLGRFGSTSTSRVRPIVSVRTTSGGSSWSGGASSFRSGGFGGGFSGGGGGGGGMRGR